MYHQYSINLTYSQPHANKWHVLVFLGRMQRKIRKNKHHHRRMKIQYHFSSVTHPSAETHGPVWKARLIHHRMRRATITSPEIATYGAPGIRVASAANKRRGMPHRLSPNFFPRTPSRRVKEAFWQQKARVRFVSVSPAKRRARNSRA